MARPLVLLSIAVALGGCSPEQVAPPVDAGTVDAGTSLTDACMVAPAPVEAPRLTDWVCPAGWESVPAHDVPAADLANEFPPAIKVCAPPALPTSCPDGQRAAVGSAACQTVGDPCPAGDFPAVPAGAVLYVKAGAAGGDGSSAGSPLGSIAQALTAAQPGTTIAIAKGTYSEYLPVTKAVTLLGACAQQTLITAPTRSAVLGTIDVGAAATLKNLQVGGPRPGVWVLNNTDFAVLQGVIIKSAELIGVFSDHGRVQLDDVLITGTRADPADGSMGRALQVRTGGLVRSTGLTVENNRDVALTLDGAGCAADLSDLLVRDTQSETASNAYGLGMEVRYGAQATVRRAVFERNRNTAIVSDQLGSKVTLLDVVLQDTLPQANNNQYGGGLELGAATAADLTRVLIRRNRASGVRLGGRATLTATDLAVTDTAARLNDNTQGLGLVMDTMSQADLTRAVFAQNHVADLLVADRGTRLTLTDVRLRGARSQPSDGRWGLGLIAMTEASVVANRLAIEHTDDCGAQLQGKSVALFTDLSVRDTGFGGLAIAGDGLLVQSTSQATVTRGLFTGNRRVAVGAHDLSVVQLTDLRIRDPGPDPAGYFGRGIVLQDGAIGSVTRAEVVRAREAGLYTHGLTTRLYVDQVSVVDTLPSSAGNREGGRAISVEAGSLAEVNCFYARGNKEVAANANGVGTLLNLRRAHLLETTGPDNFGDGVAASQGATVTIEDSEVSASKTLGIGFSGAQGSLRRTRIVANAVGLYAGEGAAVKEVAEVSLGINPLEVQVDAWCVFEDNQTRIAGHNVPLPGGVAPPPKRPDF